MTSKSNSRSFSTIILAAGVSKRMHSSIPKILYKILGKPMIQYVVELAKSLNCPEIIVVTGKNVKVVKRILGNDLKYAIQETPLGTGDATKKGIVYATRPELLILYGDVPLLKKETVNKMIENHHRKSADLSVLTCEIDNPAGYGRIIRDKGGKLLRIVEHVDASVEQLKIKEINTGIYFGARNLISDALALVRNENQQKEFYLTDIIHYLIEKNKKVIPFKIENEEEILGVNTKLDLARVREIVKKKWFEELMLKGVYIEDPSSTNIDLTVKIGNSVHIRPYTFIEGDTTIPDNSVIGPFVWIKDGKKRRMKP
ncbi:MAG: NTP transferase domain-containing protein [candidate division WOR-3 bacterium]|nr:NTP transferase domain-containing protein [candidate division WOR-3 bacterium]